MRKEKQTDRDKHRHDMFFSAKTGAVRSVLQIENRKFRKEQNRLHPLKKNCKKTVVQITFVIRIFQSTV